MNCGFYDEKRYYKHKSSLLSNKSTADFWLFEVAVDTVTQVKLL